MTCPDLYALGRLISGCFLFLFYFLKNFFLVLSRELEKDFFFKVFILLFIENVQKIEIFDIRLG